MRIVKPAALGLLQKPFRYRKQHHLAVSALGFFALGSEQRAFLPEQTQWPLVMAALPPNEPLDFAMPKARGEMLLAATAYAPRGEAVASMTARASLAEIDKSLLIIGEREWLYGLYPLYQLTDPKPFLQMPIGYNRAFGGPSCAANPLGVGHLGWHVPALFGANRGKAWNIEDPREPVGSPHMAHPPAGFGPLDIRSPARQAKAGTYGKRWLKEDFPGLPDDVDWALFNAAPPGQQRAGYFDGREAYRLEGLHPTKAVVEGHLPGLLARAFIQYRGNPPSQAREIPLVCDTVWFFPSQDLGVVIYRGQTSIQDSDALDVESVMLAYEAADAVPRDLEHYREALRLRSDPTTAALHAFNDAPLIPVVSEPERAARRRTRAKLEAETLAERQAVVDELTREFWSRAGRQPPADYTPPKAEPPMFPPITPESIATGEVNLVETLATAKARAESVRAESEAKLAEAQRRAGGIQQPPISAEAQLRDALARACVVAQDLVGGDAASALPHPLQSFNIDSIDPNQRAQLVDAAAKLPALQRQARRAAPQPLFPKPPLAPEVAGQFGEAVREWRSRRVCLAGRDLAGAQLSGANFEGADLREVMLEQADLSHANFRGANLSGAVLTASCLEHADFSGANLTNATLASARAGRACLRDARLEAAILTGASFVAADLTTAVLRNALASKTDFTSARLVGCDLTQAVLTDAIAEEAIFNQAKFGRSVLLNTKLRRAQFCDATLERTALVSVEASETLWRGARLTRVQAAGNASFLRADMTDVTARQCGWRGADLRDSNLAGSRFVICDFGKCRLDRTDLTGALLWRSIFMQASLHECRLDGADFFQAMCRKADFRGSSLATAHLLQADLSEALLGELGLEGEAA